MSGLHFGVRFWTPKRGPFCRQILVTGRKIARGSMVSARMRQKFSMPLLFHGFAAPQALVLDALRTFMATHVLEQFKNRKLVGINVRRAWRTIAGGAAKPSPGGTQWPAVCRQNFCRVPAETIETCTILHSPDGKNFVPTNGPRFGIQKRTPKRGPSRPDTSKSN